MMLMRPPQHGHAWVGLSVAAALLGACGLCAVCAGAAAAISSRARAMVSVLVPLASSPQCLIRWNPFGKTRIRNGRKTMTSPHNRNRRNGNDGRTGK